MWLIGLILPICYVPGYLGASIPTQWVVLWAVLPLALWRPAPVNFLHLLWIVFLAYALVAFTWTPNTGLSIFAVAIAAVWALSFWLGSLPESLRPLWKGLAIGMSASSAVALLQVAGINPVMTAWGYPGLFVNPTVSGAAAALVLVALIQHRLWFYIPGALPGLVLAQSRGAWLAVVLAMLCRYFDWRAAVSTLAAAGLAFYLWQGPSDIVRLQIWQLAAMHLSPLGAGPGTFGALGIQTGQMGLVHNDYLQIVFEYGVGSLAIFVIMGAALAQTERTEHPVLVAFLALGLFWFPLYSPLTAFIGTAVAGHLVRDWSLVRALDRRRRLDAAPRFA